MKLSSISLIAAAFAAIAGSAIAAPRPLEQYSLQRGVDIYSRGLKYVPYYEDWPLKEAHKDVAKFLDDSANISKVAACHTRNAQVAADIHKAVIELQQRRDAHRKAAENEFPTLLQDNCQKDRDYALKMQRYAEATLPEDLRHHPRLLDLGRIL